MKKRYQLIIDIESKVSDEFPLTGHPDKKILEQSKEIYDAFIKDDEALTEFFKFYIPSFFINCIIDAEIIRKYLKAQDLEEVLNKVAERVSPAALNYVKIIFQHNHQEYEYRLEAQNRQELITGEIGTMKIKGARFHSMN